MQLFLAVLEAIALVVLEHSMASAEVAFAELAVADDALCSRLALLEAAPDLAGRHSAAEGQRHVEGGGCGDAVGLQR